MTSKPRIRAVDLVKDIRSGMIDSELMAKYNLSGKGLRKVCEKLVDMGAIEPSEFYPASTDTQPTAEPMGQDTAIVEQTRGLRRLRLAVPVPVYSDDPPVQGVVRDITEKGVGVKGIDARMNETRRFVIRPDRLIRGNPIIFTATCRWIHREGPGDFLSGFEITEISDESLNDLREFVRLLESDSE